MKDFANASVSSTTDTTVTLVRRRVVYDEMLITREEFNKLNEKIESDDEYEIGYEVVNQLIPDVIDVLFQINVSHYKKKILIISYYPSNFSSGLTMFDSRAQTLL